MLEVIMIKLCLPLLRPLKASSWLWKVELLTNFTQSTAGHALSPRRGDSAVVSGANSENNWRAKVFL